MPATHFLRFMMLGIFIAILAAPAGAQDFRIGSLAVSQPWLRATPSGTKVGGGYLTITNSGTQSDRLLGASLPGAGHAEVHEMKSVEGVVQMRPLSNGLEIKPGQTLKLEPGGYHFMFMGLERPFKEGDMLKGQLRFERSGALDVEFKVESMAAQAPTHGPAEHHH